jgi:hypothetical protein
MLQSLDEVWGSRPVLDVSLRDPRLGVPPVHHVQVGLYDIPRRYWHLLHPGNSDMMGFHMCVPYFFHTISPCHSSSHCRLGRSGQGGSAFCADFPMSFSRRFLSMRRCLVVIKSDMTRRGFGSSCLHVLNSSRWSTSFNMCM